MERAPDSICTPSMGLSVLFLTAVDSQTAHGELQYFGYPPLSMPNGMLYHKERYPLL